MVVVAGGWTSANQLTITASAELYNPVAGNWGPTGSLSTARASHTSTFLSNGMVLVAGGDNSAYAGVYATEASSELYNPVAGTWSPAGSLTTARWAHTATLLPNGLVVAAGGETNLGPAAPSLPSAELYR
jgi:N-acetylneuraminic acid mutarotase